MLLHVLSCVVIATSGTIGYYSVSGWRRADFSESSFLSVSRGIIAGVLLSTGLTNLLPRGIKDLEPWAELPIGGMAVLLGCGLVMALPQRYFLRVSVTDEAQNGLDGPAAVLRRLEDIHAIRAKVEKLIPVIGAHSVLFGFCIGVSTDPYAVWPLTITLSLFNLYEGMFLGNDMIQIAQQDRPIIGGLPELIQIKFRLGSVSTIYLFYALTMPLSVALVSSIHNDLSPRNNMLQGVLTCVTSGMLTYLGLVGANVERNWQTIVSAFIAAGLMTVLAW
ncbi:hypothetical protein CFC21_087876 [Triticum aestivum]|uniref:Solute carrier family 40 protein n=2 Tax=Triticum aestivum TaxID=4565 RepID=A0A9R1IIF8_WHEAT|nr:zinc transporter 5-like [Triticum dicoccoides]XP_044409329.1 zinc transporter 5-like [Triticum aestivum]KAF7084199.1 hypothetical protein CFC21_087876 [Triticum aestivum]